MIGWTAVIFAIQGWLAETPAQAASATTPSYLQVGMAAMSLGVVSIVHLESLSSAESQEGAVATIEKGAKANFYSGLHAPFLASYHERRVFDWPCTACCCLDRRVTFNSMAGIMFLRIHCSKGSVLVSCQNFKRCTKFVRELRNYIHIV